MKKLLAGVAVAGFTMLLGLAGAQAQSGMGQTGMGDARMKDAPTASAMGRHGMRRGMRHMRMHHRHHMRHHHRHMM